MSTGAESMSGLCSPPKWPVIVHSSLRDTDVFKLLQAHHKDKVRVSESTLPNTIIFPLSSHAFMLLLLNEVTKEQTPGGSTSASYRFDEALIQGILKFTQLHRHCYLLCLAPLHSSPERAILSAIQKRFLDTNLRLLPIHNAKECVTCMFNIAKVTCRPANLVLRERLQQMIAKHQSEDCLLTALRQIGLSQHESMVLLDSAGSLANIGGATRSTLLESSLDSRTVDRVLEYFTPQPSN